MYNSRFQEKNKIQENQKNLSICKKNMLKLENLRKIFYYHKIDYYTVNLILI